MKEAYQKIIQKLGKERVESNKPMGQYTTFGIGGPADLFYEAKTTEELIEVVKLVRDLKVPYFVLGKGSNLLVSDKGFRGLVVKNSTSGMKIVRKLKKAKKASQATSARYFAAHPKKYLEYSDLDYPDEPFSTEIEVLSGTPLQNLIQWSLENGLTGLQWFAGIPGTVGGAVVFNIHGGAKLFSTYLSKLTVLDQKNKRREIEKSDLKLDYDFSDIPQKKMIILKVNLFLAEGDLKKAKHVYKEWWERKKPIQPQKNSPGCIFKNFSEEVAKKLGAPTPGAGWYIDQCGLKGKKIGGAQISFQHANFIVNSDQAKAEDVLALINLAQKEVKEKFGVELEKEIQLVGFDKLDISG